MPIGPARLAELHPGVSVDATVLAAGFAAIVMLLVARATWTAWRESSVRLHGAASAPAAPGYGSRAARWLAGSGAPVTAVTGVRMALDPGRGRSSAPAHSALIGTALAVAAFMASVTFGANLVHLERTPRLYGKTWDVAMDLQFGTIAPDKFDKYVKAVPGLAAWTFGLHGTVTVGRHGGVVPAIGLAQGRGRLLTPTILAGRPPAAGQLVLGTSTMRDGAFRVGQAVDVAASGPSQPLRVVGRAVFPYFGQGSFTPTDLGAGALVPASMLAAQAEQASGSGYNFVLLKFAPGPRKAADIAAFKQAVAKFCASVQQSTCVVTNQQPNGVINYEPVDATPLILARAASDSRPGRAGAVRVPVRQVPAPRLRGAADARLAPEPAHRRHVLADQHGHRASAADRPAGRRGDRPLGLGAVCRRAGYLAWRLASRSRLGSC